MRGKKAKALRKAGKRKLPRHQRPKPPTTEEKK